MLFQHATGVLDPERSSEDLTKASLALAAESLGAAAEQFKVSRNNDEVTIDAELAIESLSEAVAEGGLEIGKYAARVGKAAKNLKKEIARNSDDLDYDSVMIGDEADGIEISFDH